MPTSSDKEQALVLLQINEAVDMKLLEVLRDALKTQGTLKISAVLATLSYMVADGITQGEPLSQNSVCILAGAYGEYIHQCAHWMQDIEDIKSGKDQTRQ